ncbi:MAG: alkaline phosphatase family protein, partial [Chromatiales bacterium]
MPVPDYRARSIVNLMSSLIRGLGGPESIYPPLPSLAPAEVADHRCVVLLVLDGLGYRYLLRESPEGPLAGHLRDRLTSVFPSTTATAVTTFLTGDAPQQHGLTGWHMYLRELGSVIAVLPGRPRFGGPPVAQAAGVGAGHLFGHVPVFDRIPVPSCVVAPARIAGSDFNRAHAGVAEVRAYETPNGFFDRLAAAVEDRRGFRYVYGYLPDLDGAGHAHGMASAAARAQLRAIEDGFEALRERLSGTGALLLATADHGQVDTTEDDRVLLEDHPELGETLLLPLCGEPRAAYCYVRAGATSDFESYVREELGHCVDLRHS